MFYLNNMQFLPKDFTPQHLLIHIPPKRQENLHHVITRWWKSCAACFLFPIVLMLYLVQLIMQDRVTIND